VVQYFFQGGVFARLFSYAFFQRSRPSRVAGGTVGSGSFSGAIERTSGDRIAVPRGIPKTGRRTA